MPRRTASPLLRCASLLVLAGPVLAEPAPSPSPTPPRPAPVAARPGGSGALAAGPRVAAALLAEETVSQGAWKKLEWLTDRIGNRISGSPAADRAVAWAVRTMAAEGADAARAEPVLVPRWVRGEGSVEVTAPTTRPLAFLALGGSVGTDAYGMSGPVVAVSSLEELHAKGGEVAGSVVLIDKPIVPNGGEKDGYGAGSKLRYYGPPEAAKLGAVGMVIRSLGTSSMRLPHTGGTGYEDGVARIPAAAISAEDADLLARLLASGDRVEACIRLTSRTLADVWSANAVGELRGRERPDEIVVVGGHLDSWDVGQGAIDDGAGVVVAMETLRLLRALDLRPRRTVRAVLFMNEENGLRGGEAYARDHAAELAHHVAAIESDSGGARPIGFYLDAGAGASERFLELLQPLSGTGVAHLLGKDDTGADLSPLAQSGIPRLGLRQDMTHYFDWHHTEADTLDKITRDELALNAVAMAYAAWALAEDAEPLARAVPLPVLTPVPRKGSR